MKLRRLVIERFGLWTNVAFGPLRPGIQVFLGPNEAGKTTLSQFIEAVLFGKPEVSPADARGLGDEERQSRANLASWAGSIDGIHQQEHVRLRRQGDSELCRPLVWECAKSGTRRAVGSIAELFPQELPVNVVRRIFFFNLRELQQLALLSREAVANLLFATSTSLIGVPFASLLRKCESQLRTFVDDEGSGLLRQLEEKLGLWDGESKRLCRQTQEAQAIVDKIRSLRQKAEQVAAELKQAEERHALYQLAFRLYPLWERKNLIGKQLETLGTVPEGVVQAAQQVEKWQQKSARISQRISELRSELSRLREQRQALGHPREYRAIGRQVERLVARQERLLGLERQAAAAQRNLSQLRAEQAESVRSFPAAIAEHWPKLVRLGGSECRRLLRHAKKLVNQRIIVSQLKEEVSRAESEYRDLRQRLEERLGGLAPEQLPRRIEELARQVETIRQLALRRNRFRELEELERLLAAEYDTLRAQPAVPPAWRMLVGVLLTGGTLAVLTSAVGPFGFLGGWGWPLLGVGGIGLSTAILVRYFLESAHVRKIASCLEQLEEVRQCLSRCEVPADLAGRERSLNPDLQADASKAGGTPGDGEVSLTSPSGELGQRLARAEAELAALQKLAPDCAALAHQAERSQVLRQQQKAAEEELAAIDRDWQEAIGHLGLAGLFSAEEYLDAFGKLMKLRKLVRKLKKAELSQRYWQRRVKVWGNRLRRLEEKLAERPADVDFTSLSLTDRLTRLRELYQQMAERHRQAKDVARRIAALRRALRSLRAAHERCRRHVRQALRSVGAASAEEVYQLAHRAREIDNLRHERQMLERNLENQIRLAARPDVLELLANEDQASLQTGLETSREHLERLKAELASCEEELARLEKERSDLAWAQKWWEVQAERSFLRRSLRRAATTTFGWVLVRQALLAARGQFERLYQPEALQIASRLLEGMTGGRYRRVWSAMDSDKLLVEDRTGRPWPIECLSQGTCDQIYICIRLALAALYARRGVELPLVLDDVLVNFDARRLRHAARTLRRWAGDHFQVIVLTCHPHVARVFGRLGAPVFFLPTADLHEAKEADSHQVIRWVAPRRLKISKNMACRHPSGTVPESLQDAKPGSDDSEGKPGTFSNGQGPGLPAEDAQAADSQTWATIRSDDDRRLASSQRSAKQDSTDSTSSPPSQEEPASSQAVDINDMSSSISPGGSLSAPPKLRVFRGEVAGQGQSGRSASSPGESPPPQRKVPPSRGKNLHRPRAREIRERKDAGQPLAAPPTHLGTVEPEAFPRAQDNLQGAVDFPSADIEVREADEKRSYPSGPGSGEIFAVEEGAQLTAQPAAEVPEVSPSDSLGETEPVQSSASDSSDPSEAKVRRGSVARQVRPRVEYWGNHQGSFDAQGRPLGPFTID